MLFEIKIKGFIFGHQKILVLCDHGYRFGRSDNELSRSDCMMAIEFRAQKYKYHIWNMVMNFHLNLHYKFHMF